MEQNVEVEEVVKRLGATPAHKARSSLRNYLETLDVLKRGIYTTTQVEFLPKIAVVSCKDRAAKVSLLDQRREEDSLGKLFYQAGKEGWNDKYKPAYDNAHDACADAPTGLPFVVALLGGNGETWKVWDFFTHTAKCPHYTMWVYWEGEKGKKRLFLQAQQGNPEPLERGLDSGSEGYHLAFRFVQ